VSFRINTNVAAINTLNHLYATQRAKESNLERLSSGLRINRAADDAAGYALSEQMTKYITGMEQAERNAQDAISFIHVAEGGMELIDEKLQRLRQLAIQASTETYSSADREKIQMEVDQLVAEIDRLASATQFNEIRMLKGGQYDIHVGQGEDETIRITVTSVDVTALGIRNLAVTGATNTNAEDAVTSLDAAISIKIRERTELGAYEVRLQNIIASLQVMQENQSAARSRIRDLDFAKEAMAFTRNQILEQSGLAMLAQANAQAQNVLGLI
jgi:flagellin